MNKTGLGSGAGFAGRLMSADETRLGWVQMSYRQREKVGALERGEALETGAFGWVGAWWAGAEPVTLATLVKVNSTQNQ